MWFTQSTSGNWSYRMFEKGRTDGIVSVHYMQVVSKEELEQAKQDVDIKHLDWEL